MRLRLWAPVLLAFAVGCATSEAPAHKAKKPAPVEDDSSDESDVGSEAAAPPHREGPSAPAPAPVPEKEAPTAPPAVAAADAGAPPDEKPKRTAADPFGDVGFKEVNQKDWLANLREKIAQQEKVPPAELRVSPGLLRAAYVRSPAIAPVKPGRRVAPRRREIVVVDNQGRQVAKFRAVAAKHGDEPPKDLRFLSEDRLVYEVVEPPPEAPVPGKPLPRKAKLAARAKKVKAPRFAAPAPHALPLLPPPRTFVIQPLAPRARPIKCVGVHFTFSRDKDRLAFVSGTAEAGFVAVDGAQVYPRRGRTAVASAPAWSKDGRSLAFLEARATQPTRLVLLAELDNPTGDTTWDLPPTANTDGALVFWAGLDKLVVGKTQMRPIFSASFTKEAPGR
jgi:hypothetical protein